MQKQAWLCSYKQANEAADGPHPHFLHNFPLIAKHRTMLLSKVLGVIVIARNGDRYNYYQDPKTYAGSNTETTALGVVSIPPYLSVPLSPRSPPRLPPTGRVP